MLIKNVTFEDNEAFSGGGLSVAAARELQMVDCTFKNNTAREDRGGAVALINVSGNLTV